MPRDDSSRAVLRRLAKRRTRISQEAWIETEAIAGVSGGRKVPGKAVKKPDDLAQLIRKGLPAGSVPALA